METLSIILIYIVLPLIVIFGVMIFIRRKREKDAGRRSSVTGGGIETNEAKDIKAKESPEKK